MTPVRHVIYLHGFASSPGSSKAQRFARELEAVGVTFACPDFNQPVFESLTITRMLDQVDREITNARPGPIALIGSSLGGFVAIVHAQRAASAVDRLILLAPAVDFGGNRLSHFGEHSIEDWRRAGRLSVHHHAFDRVEPIGFGLCEDAARYDAFGQSSHLPALVFQGRRDLTVDPAAVARWADGSDGVELRMLDDGHQLTASLDLIWEESRRFLGVSRA